MSQALQATRHERLKQLIRASYQGSQAQFSAHTHIHPTDVSAMISQKRGIGTRKVWKIEQLCGLPVGWMDNAVVNGQENDALSRQAVLRAWQQLHENARALGDALQDYQRAEGRTHRTLLVEVVGKLVDTICQNHRTFCEAFEAEMERAASPEAGIQSV